MRAGEPFRPVSFYERSEIVRSERAEIKKLKKQLRALKRELDAVHVRMTMQYMLIETHTVMFGDLKNLLEYHGLWPTKKRTKLEAQRKMRKQDILRMKPHSRAVN